MAEHKTTRRFKYHNLSLTTFDKYIKENTTYYFIGYDINKTSTDYYFVYNENNLHQIICKNVIFTADSFLECMLKFICKYDKLTRKTIHYINLIIDKTQITNDIWKKCILHLFFCSEYNYHDVARIVKIITNKTENLSNSVVNNTINEIFNKMNGDGVSFALDLILNLGKIIQYDIDILIKYIQCINRYDKNNEMFSLFTDVSLDRYSLDIITDYFVKRIHYFRNDINEDRIFSKIVDPWKSRRLCLVILRHKCVVEKLYDTLDITKIDPVVYWICKRCPMWCFQQIILLI